MRQHRQFKQGNIVAMHRCFQYVIPLNPLAKLLISPRLPQRGALAWRSLCDRFIVVVVVVVVVMRASVRVLSVLSVCA